MNSIVKKIALIAFPINFLWEMGQMPFYSNMSYNLVNTLYCTVASAGDVLMISLIYISVSLIIKDERWIYKKTNNGLVLAIIIGLLLAFLVEFAALNLGLWAYSNRMPIIGNIKVGLFPIIQMVLLPYIVFYIIKITQQKALN